MRRNEIPVSYTHLDVYKRQVWKGDRYNYSDVLLVCGMRVRARDIHRKTADGVVVHPK